MKQIILITIISFMTTVYAQTTSEPTEVVIGEVKELYYDLIRGEDINLSSVVEFIKPTFNGKPILVFEGQYKIFGGIQEWMTEEDSALAFCKLLKFDSGQIESTRKVTQKTEFMSEVNRGFKGEAAVSATYDEAKGKYVFSDQEAHPYVSIVSLMANKITCGI